jgi:hypothetical protein
LWCLWKAQNDTLFCRKVSKPSQVYAATNAIIKGNNLEVNSTIRQQGHDNSQEQNQLALPTPEAQDANLSSRNIIYCDAAWERRTDAEKNRVGLEIVIQFQGNQHLQELHVSALSPPASSPLQAETFGLLLATKLADILQVQDPFFYTDSSILALAAASPAVFGAPGHWENRPHLAAIQASPSFHCNNIAHIGRSRNIKADHHARLALRLQNSP